MRNNAKKITAMILTVVMALTMLSMTAFAEPKADSWSKCSEWARASLEKADAYGLIPQSLAGADMTKSITRAEFAAVAVTFTEALAGMEIQNYSYNPFTDTKDTYVLKAYKIGLIAGISQDKFGPDQLLTREQAATMLTRIFKVLSIEGWTLATDGNYKIVYDAPKAFADDAKISSWAKQSVYFMAVNSFIAGVGNNTFNPQGNTTREQAFAIVVRIADADSLIGEFALNDTPVQPEPSGDTFSIIGKWGRGSGGKINYEYYQGGSTWITSMDFGSGYMFNSDGTFEYYIIGFGTLNDGIATIKGKYRIEDKHWIYFTECTTSWWDADNPAENYVDKHYDDFNRYIQARVFDGKTQISIDYSEGVGVNWFDKVN